MSLDFSSMLDLYSALDKHVCVCVCVCVLMQPLERARQGHVLTREPDNLCPQPIHLLLRSSFSRSLHRGLVSSVELWLAAEMFS